MNYVEKSEVPDPATDAQEIEIEVNDRPVTLIGHRHIGSDIKKAAIAQGVPIGLDFVLSIERGPRQTKIIEDTDAVGVTRHSRFVAIPDDDNS
jgi:hypothetical protein